MLLPPEDPAAVRRVKNALPAPVRCPHCDSLVEAVNNAEIYGSSYGDWPWVYRCVDVAGCGAHVGMHPRTHIPLGTLATAALRDARKTAKNLFNPLWQGGGMSRTQAYQWLARRLRIDAAACHFGWFDEAQCAQAVAALHRRR